jgi:shikimate dehydrogenase
MAIMDILDYVTGKTCLAGLIGNPLEHSISPQIHNTISSLTGIDLVYVPFKVREKDLGIFVKGLKSVNVIGFNVTVPYKQKIMSFLDQIDDEAEIIGAVNTVKNTGGRLCGYNTDGEGFLRSVEKETGVSLQGRNIALIGAGGAARAIGIKAAIRGAKRITVINRTIKKAEDLVKDINKKTDACADAADIADFKQSCAIEEYDVIVNTTSAGMYPDVDLSPLDDSTAFKKSQIVYDVIYNPFKTRFLLMAEKRGCKTLNGLGMLINQGISAYEIWTGIKVDDEITKGMHAGFGCSYQLYLSQSAHYELHLYEKGYL